ncbi:MAG: hypothetical protein IJO31_04660, partial [Oscillospiraceae bacterium]|nr:hypothetical protein [Oscillospiraceae bacterium]
MNEEIRKIKCGADERRRCRLDGTEQSYLPAANMQTNLLKSTYRKTPPKGRCLRLSKNSAHMNVGAGDYTGP